MPDIRIRTQYSVFLVNKPGVLAQVTSALADEKINIVAMTLVDSQEHGVLRFVTDDGDHVRQALAQLNLPTTETEVLCVELPNRPGALAGIAGLMGKNHININYAYVTSGSPGGHTIGVFKVADLKKAMKLLHETGGKHREPSIRRVPSRR
ncbi:MAG: ACT domain-containing protein [Planctomycetota bacterium]|nr:ACT domain-containing protein [Planctomycetota bacterium]